MAKRQNKTDEVLEGKIYALLSYLSICCIIPLVLQKDNKFVLMHGKQGLVIFIGEVATFIISIVFPWAFKLGLFIFGIYSLVGIINVLKGEYYKLPIVSEIADKIIL